MDLFECAVGQRVTHRDTGKPATIKALWRAEGEIEIQFDSGSIQRVHPRQLAAGGGPGSARPPQRPCPQCGADLGTEAACAKCGFAYRPARRRGVPLAYPLVIALVVVAAIGFVAWKFLLGGKLP